VLFAVKVLGMAAATSSKSRMGGGDANIGFFFSAFNAKARQHVLA